MIKKNIILIPDAMNWALGKWASAICGYKKDDYNFFILPVEEISQSRSLFLSLCRSADIIHCFDPWITQKLKHTVTTEKQRNFKLIAHINHIVDMEDAAPCFDADKIVVMCELYKEMLIRKGIDEKRIFLMNYGIDSEHFKILNKAECRKKYNISDNSFAVGFSAKMSSEYKQRKGTDILLEVVNNLSDEIKSRLHLCITGPAWENHLQKFSLPESQIRWHRYLPESELPFFYNSLDMFIVTARHEGGPVPLFEAMSCGVPVISTPVGMAKDFIKNSENGIMTGMENSHEIIAGINKIFRDKTFAEKIAAGGRKTVVENLGWKKVLSGIDNLYGFTDFKPGKKSSGIIKFPFLEKTVQSLVLKKDNLRWKEHVNNEKTPIDSLKRNALSFALKISGVLNLLTGENR